MLRCHWAQHLGCIELRRVSALFRKNEPTCHCEDCSSQFSCDGQVETCLVQDGAPMATLTHPAGGSCQVHIAFHARISSEYGSASTAADV